MVFVSKGIIKFAYLASCLESVLHSGQGNKLVLSVQVMLKPLPGFFSDYSTLQLCLFFNSQLACLTVVGGDIVSLMFK